MIKVLCLLLSILSTAAHAQQTPSAAVTAEAAYQRGEYEQSMQIVDKALLRDWELSGPERSKLYLLKARLLFAFDRQQEISFWLRKAYASDPEASLDPIRDPPTMIDTMTKIRNAESSDPTVDEQDQRSFVVGIMPFGIGHMDSGRVREGLLFLSTESLLLVASQGLADQGNRGATTFLGAMSFLGTYSYELLDMLPELQARDPEATQSLRWYMNFAPFGAAQAKNGELGKAFGFAALQSVLLTLGTVTDNPATRASAYSVLGITWVFSMIDGFSYFPRSSASAVPLEFYSAIADETPLFGARWRF